MKSTKKHLIAFFLSASSALAAQDADSLYISSDSTFFSSNDSLSIFQLIDSLLLQDNLYQSSQLTMRLGYNSNVVAAGRTLGIENFGLSPGLSYYHTSGVFADVSGFWSNDFDPAYYLTITSIGYSHIFSKGFSLLAGYDRYFYNAPEDAYIPYKNSFSFSPSLDVKPFTIAFTYSFYFGDKYVHRVLPSLGFILQKKKIWGIDRVAMFPSVSMLVGNEVITEIKYVETVRELIFRLRNKQPLFDEINTNVFGVMNYALTIPISISHKKWNFIFSYAYNIPKALPRETLTLTESSLLSANISYIFSLRQRKSLWE
jgi:hypothetical protein